MKTNTLLTYILYLVLAGLIGMLVYKSCQLKRNQADLAKQNDEFQKNLRDYGYLSEDSTESQFVGEENTTSTKGADSATSAVAPATQPGASLSNNGIEDEDPVPVSVPKEKTSKQIAAPPKSAAPKTTDSDRVRNLDEDDASDGRYRVVAGSFTVLDGARREMERLIKMGFHDAEVGRYNRGKYAVVIVKRTNNLNEANRIADQLQRKGIDASVIDRQRKK